MCHLKTYPYDVAAVNSSPLRPQSRGHDVELCEELTQLSETLRTTSCH
jgi:hypothetical protein